MPIHANHIRWLPSPGPLGQWEAQAGDWVITDIYVPSLSSLTPLGLTAQLQSLSFSWVGSCCQDPMSLSGVVPSSWWGRPSSSFLLVVLVLDFCCYCLFVYNKGIESRVLCILGKCYTPSPLLVFYCTKR